MIINLYKHKVMNRKKYLILLIVAIAFTSYILFKATDSEKLVGRWSIDYVINDKRVITSKGSMYFEPNGLCVMKDDESNASADNWKIYDNDIIKMGSVRYKYEFKGKSIELVSVKNDKFKWKLTKYN